LLNDLLDHPIQLTTYLLPCELLSRILRFVSVSAFAYATYHSYCIQALGCNPLDKNTTLSHTS